MKKEEIYMRILLEKVDSSGIGIGSLKG